MLQEFITNHRHWILILWVVSGLIGFSIFLTTRKDFYTSRKTYWWAFTTTYYLAAGPLIFICALITLFTKPKKRHHVITKTN